MSDKIRVLLADDTFIARAGWSRILESAGDIEVTAMAETAGEVLKLVSQVHPDVIMLDMKWFGDEDAGVKLIKELKSCFPEVTIIALSAYTHLLPDARKAGADATLSKGFSRPELVSTVRASDYEARSHRIESRLTSIIRDRMAKGKHNQNEVMFLREKLADLRATIHELSSIDKQYGYQDDPTYIESRRRLLQRMYSIEVDLEFDYFDSLPVEATTKALNTITILFLAADPTDASRLRLGEELREIQEKLQLARLRDRYVLHQRTSVRPTDISQALLDVQPTIVHFSGHGTSTGELCFEDLAGKTHPIEPDTLAALFEHFSDQVSCVILNACFSDFQASAIAKHIDCVIGMNQAVGDKAAIAFAVGYYQALGAGRTIEDAYKLGCVQIRLQGIPEHLTPVIIKKSHSQI